MPEDDPAGVPADWAGGDNGAKIGRDGPFVTTSEGVETPDERQCAACRTHLRPPNEASSSLGRPTWARAVRYGGGPHGPPVCGPASDLRFGPHVDRLDVPVCGGYDGYLGSDSVDQWDDPDVVVRFGASPTSKPLRHYLRDADCQQSSSTRPAAGRRPSSPPRPTCCQPRRHRRCARGRDAGWRCSVVARTVH